MLGGCWPWFLTASKKQGQIRNNGAGHHVKAIVLYNIHHQISSIITMYLLLCVTDWYIGSMLSAASCCIDFTTKLPNTCPLWASALSPPIKFLPISLPSTQINSVHSTAQPLCLAQKGREHLKPTLCFIKRPVWKRETLVLGCGYASDGNLEM